jgi:hypothetical protein
MTHRKLRTKVFLYLENNLNDFRPLTLDFLKYMLSFLRIDQERTMKLLWNIKKEWVDH